MRLPSTSDQVPLTPEELRALVLYAAAIHDDDDQLLDYLPLLMSIMLEQPTSVTEAFFRSGGGSWGAGALPPSRSEGVG